MRFTVQQHMPPKSSELRWCVMRDGQFFCDRDTYTLASDLCRELNRADEERSQREPIQLADRRRAELIKGEVSFERSLSHSEVISMHRTTRGESYRIDDDSRAA